MIMHPLEKKNERNGKKVRARAPPTMRAITIRKDVYCPTSP